QQSVGFQDAHGTSLLGGTKKGSWADQLPPDIGPPISRAAYVFSRLFCRDLRRRVRRVDHRYVGATLEPLAERDLTVAKREERMVLAHSDVLARPELGAALAHDDVAARDGFAAEQLHAEHLGVRVASVARGTACFLVCHTLVPTNPACAAEMPRRR